MKQGNHKKTRFWDARRGVIRTRKGGWVIGKGVTSHGYSLLDELLGNVSYFQVIVLNVTGRLPEQRLAKWLEAVFICSGWPDPRLWPNYIGALGGTMRTSPVAAVCVGTLASDSRIYGPGTLVDSADFIAEAMLKKNQGCSVSEIIDALPKGPGGQIKAPGYIRPFAKGDERIVSMQRVADELGFSIGPHLELAYEMQSELNERYGESMNLSAYVVAFLMDQDFSASEIYRFGVLGVSGGVHACYAEAADHPAESFLPLRCEDIEYRGKPERRVPPG